MGKRNNLLYLPPDNKNTKGLPALSMDRVMLQYMWVNYLIEKDAAKQTEYSDKNEHARLQDSFIIAGIGMPTFPINYTIAPLMIDYWLNIQNKTIKARENLYNNRLDDKKKHSIIASLKAVIDYGHPQGDDANRVKMAKALNQWYFPSIDFTTQSSTFSSAEDNIVFKAENIFFHVGGVGGIDVVFHYLKEKNPLGRIITPLPHYSLYPGLKGDNNLFPIDVTSQSGYKLNARILQESIDKANKLAEIDGGNISAFLFCEPNNPLGTCLSEEEWQEIARVLRNTPADIPIILDEAYTEMRFDEKHISLLTVAPDLQSRIILFRSATKALSAAGERMAVTVAFNQEIMAKLVAINTSKAGHAPRSAQAIYALTMEEFSSDDNEQHALITFYKPQVNAVAECLQKIGAYMPDKDYKVGGTFYILADLSDLLGQPIPEAAKAALGDEKTIMETDVDIVYSLLFDKKIMIAPASNFGISAEKGYVRITCSGGNEQLNELLNRIECALQEARLNKYLKFKEQLATVYNKFQQTPYSCKEESSSLHNEINILFSKQQHPELTASELKEKCKKIQQLTIKLKANLAVPEDKNRATCKIQFFFRKHRGKKTINALKEADSKLFFSWLKKEFQPEVIPVFANYNVVERREKFCFYRKHLKALAGENIISDLNNNVLQTDIKMQQK